MTQPAQWHADAAALQAYATGGATDAVAWSIETHLPTCVECRQVPHPTVDRPGPQHAGVGPRGTGIARTLLRTYADLRDRRGSPRTVVGLDRHPFRRHRGAADRGRVERTRRIGSLGGRPGSPPPPRARRHRLRSGRPRRGHGCFSSRRARDRLASYGSGARLEHPVRDLGFASRRGGTWPTRRLAAARTRPQPRGARSRHLGREWSEPHRASSSCGPWP
jgi:hypothetical protein